jgi:DNA polymerase I-like protein with 3'-5' exonuclease and polymerase domains
VAQACRWLGVADKGGPARRPRYFAPYRPFPLHTLPEPLRSYVDQGARALGCDPAYVALPGLAAFAGLVGNTHVIRLKRGWEEPPVFWAVAVGDSGSLKTPAYKLAINPLLKVQIDLIKEHAGKMEQYEADLAAYEARKKQRDKDVEDASDLDKPEEPVCFRFMVSDITIERLAEIEEDNPRGVLAARDELAAWINSFSRYKGKSGGSDGANWLELHSGGHLVYDRKTGDRRTIVVRGATASVAGGIQPGVLARAMTPEYLDSGMTARCLMAMPPKLLKRWSDLEIDPQVREAYEAAVRKLLELGMDKDDNGNPEPFVVRMTPEARAAWVRFYDEWGETQEGLDGDLAAAFSKLEAYAARFALLHHVVTHLPRTGSDELDVRDPSDPVDVESMTAGVELARWFAYEAERVYAMLGEKEEDTAERRLVEFIRRKGGAISARELQRANGRKYPTVAVAECALDGLATAGYGSWVERPTTAEGGRPTKDFVLCPTPDETDETSTQDGAAGQVTSDTPGGPVSDNAANGRTAPNSQFVARDLRAMPCNVSPERGAGVSSVLSGVGQRVAEPNTLETSAPAPDALPARAKVENPAADTSVGQARSGHDAIYTLVTDPALLPSVRVALDESVLVGLDVETTGLNPCADRVRLLSLGTDRGTWLIDCFAVDPASLWPLLTEKTLVGHNLAFDLGFLGRLGFEPGPVRDTLILSQLLHAGRLEISHKLGDCTQRELGRLLNKELQKSDWSGPLTVEQLAYAAQDAEVPVPLYRALDAKMQEAGMAVVADLEMRCVPAVAWIAAAGMPLDRQAWEALAAQAGAEAEAAAHRLDELAPARPGHLTTCAPWNWKSKKDVGRALELLGVAAKDTTDETLAEIDHPLAQAVRDYRGAAKRAGTYGLAFLAALAPDGRLYPNWRQCGARTGRLSGAKPNLQNVPGDEAYRRCFRPREGHVFVRADFSQIELRIACKIAEEKVMLAEYRSSDADLHALTAKKILGVAEVSKEQRKLAKPINFGLIYGLGARSLARKARVEYGVPMTAEDARRYSRAFFAAYPGLAAWHRKIKHARATQTRTLLGRRVTVQANDSPGKKANYAVQGSGGDGIKLAMALLWERRAECPAGRPILTVHDEIVLEVPAGDAAEAATWLRRCMLDAMAPMIDPVPLDVTPEVLLTWGGPATTGAT